MATVEEVATRALAAVNADANIDLACQWVVDKLAEACAYARFRFLREVRAVTWPAPVEAGLVTATLGSDRVAGDADALAVWGTDLVGSFFQCAQRPMWHEITNVANGELQLATPWTGDTVTDGAYRIVQQFLVLPGMRRVDGIVAPRWRRRPLDILTQDRLNQLAPERQFLTTGPMYVSAAGETAAGHLQLELYPYSNRAETLIVYGYRQPPKLANDQHIPGAVDATLLRDGVLVEVYRFKHALALDKGDTAAAQMLNSQMVAQEGRWRVSRGLLALQDRGLDDAMIGVASSSHSYPRDIVTARDEVVARGRRP